MLLIFFTCAASYVIAWMAYSLLVAGIVYCGDLEETPEITRVRTLYYGFSAVAATVCLALCILSGWLSFCFRRGSIPRELMTGGVLSVATKLAMMPFVVIISSVVLA